MPPRFILEEPVPERVGWGYAGTLRDEAGDPIQATDFTDLTVHIYVLDAAQTAISGPDSILNADRGTLDANGRLAITFRPTDSAIIQQEVASEQHVALVQGHYSSGREFARELEWRVVNFGKRT
jgi:hypothetical protein